MFGAPPRGAFDLWVGYGTMGAAIVVDAADLDPYEQLTRSRR